MVDRDEAYGWDTRRIDNPNEDGGFTLLPAGVYRFRVTKMEKSRFEGSPKMKACAMAIMHLEIDAGELGTTTIQHRLYLNRKCDGLNCAFFVCVGLRKHGDPLDLEWERVPGTEGVAKIDIRKYQNKNNEDRETNEVKKFIEPDQVEKDKEPIPF